MRKKKVRLDPWFPMWDCEEIRCSEDLGGKLREGPADTESSRDQNADPDILALALAVLGKESSSPCSQPHYRGALDVMKEAGENKIACKCRGRESKKQL